MRVNIGTKTWVFPSIRGIELLEAMKEVCGEHEVITLQDTCPVSAAAMTALLELYGIRIQFPVDFHATMSMHTLPIPYQKWLEHYEETMYDIMVGIQYLGFNDAMLLCGKYISSTMRWKLLRDRVQLNKCGGTNNST